MKHAAVIRVWHYDKILLLKRSDGRGWCLPGGKQDEGETISTTAVRELLEETGIPVHKRLTLIGHYSTKIKEKAAQTTVFETYSVTNVIYLSREHTDYKWIDPKDIHKFTLAGKTQKAIELKP